MSDFLIKPGRLTVTGRDNGDPQGHAWIRHGLFCFAVLLSSAAYYAPLKELMRLSLHDGSYSHIPLMPVLAGAFLYVRRASIFSCVEYSLSRGALLIGLGGILYASGSAGAFSFQRSDQLSLSIFSALIVWTGAFVCCYGAGTLRRAAFPWSILLFLTPLPAFLTRPIVALLRECTAEAVDGVLRALGLPMMRDGYIFHFPKVSIKIAEECAGFHSFLALLVTALFAARLFLSKGWTRTLLVMAVVPVCVLKNTLRITVVSLIVVYMGEGAFLSAFHRLVGFSVFALFLMWSVVASLGRLEARTVPLKHRATAPHDTEDPTFP